MIELNHLLSGVKAVAAHETSRSKSNPPRWNLLGSLQDQGTLQ
jgi:hypothetical protein